MTVAAAALAGPSAYAATQFIDGYGTGWQTYSFTLPQGQSFAGTVTIGVSNHGDTLADSSLQVDNFGGAFNYVSNAGNTGFESGDSGYDVAGTRVPIGHAFHLPAHTGTGSMHLIASGADTSVYNNADGNPGTDGAWFRFWAEAAAGSLMTFNWNFLNGEINPHVKQDFAFILLDSGAFRHYEVLAQVMGAPVTPVPLPAAAWLLGSGLLALAGTTRLRRKSTTIALSA